ncbi:MAG: response regulator [Spirochaetes bacterium]|nr:response regulator [Spirochaetota bacterium]
MKKILLVEDDAIIAHSEKISLGKYGYEVVIANSGEEAVEIINNMTGIQLILMDIDLGRGIDGTEAAALILKTHDLPIVFLSSHTESDVVEKSEKITSYGYVVKNSSITVLDASLKMAFKLFESKKHAEKIAQELHIHQIELQMQNQELRTKQSELEALHLWYLELYDMAPVAYFTIAENGAILDANIRSADLLREAQAVLIKQSFTTYIVPEYQDLYYLHRKKLIETGTLQTCELQMCRQDGTVFSAFLKAGMVYDSTGLLICRMVVVELNSIIKSEICKDGSL